MEHQLNMRIVVWSAIRFGARHVITLGFLAEKPAVLLGRHFLNELLGLQRNLRLKNRAFERGLVVLNLNGLKNIIART